MNYDNEEKTVKKNKIYIIFTGTIFGMGGGQIYTKNKVDYLQKNGWKVFVFSPCYGRLFIEDLKIFEKNVFSSLRHTPSIFSHNNQRIIINAIINQVQKHVQINNRENIIIETHTIPLALWGELIAYNLNCKHFIYLLQELYCEQNLDILKFLDFKHGRKELAGIKSKSLELLFMRYKPLNKNEKYFLTACCINVVSDENNEIIDNLSKLDINIGILSNLAKPFVKTVIEEIVAFAKKYKQKKISLLLVGDSEKKHILTEKLKDAPNISCTITGYLYPLPKKIFKPMGLFISVAGAAVICAMEGALTLTVDVNSHKPIGFLGYDTSDHTYNSSEDRTDKSIQSVLEDLFIKRIAIKKSDKYTINKLTDYMIIYDEHMNFIESSYHVKKYYSGIYGSRIQFKHRVINFVLTLFNIVWFEKISKIYRAMLRWVPKA